uniref:Uncharacterized protein n=1 Tax=Arundo donax TaxID=35708 RepID=A0A0A9HHW7_ARUDO
MLPFRKGNDDSPVSHIYSGDILLRTNYFTFPTLLSTNGIA